MYEINIYYNFLKQYVESLIQQGLVEEHTLHKGRHSARVVYTITEKGRTALNHFGELNNALQITD